MTRREIWIEVIRTAAILIGDAFTPDGIDDEDAQKWDDATKKLLLELLERAERLERRAVQYR